MKTRNMRNYTERHEEHQDKGHQEMPLRGVSIRQQVCYIQ